MNPHGLSPLQSVYIAGLFLAYELDIPDIPYGNVAICFLLSGNLSMEAMAHRNRCFTY